MVNLPPVSVVSSLESLKNPALLESLLAVVQSMPPDAIKQQARLYLDVAAQLKKNGGDPADVAGLIKLSQLFFRIAAASLGNKGNNEDIEHKNPKKEDIEIKLTSAETTSVIVRECMAAAGAPSYVRECSAYVIPAVKFVGGVRYLNPATGEYSGHRWNMGHLSHCSNVWLCPDCRKYILRGRCNEVARAFARWHDAGGSCWMLTLTASHKNMTAVEMVPKLKAAYLAFRNDRAFRDLWRACPGPTGGASIIGNYEFTFGKTGTHPHRHLLFFHTGDPSEYSERLKKSWVRCCANSGLTATIDRGADFMRIEKTADYVSKIGFELCDSASQKEGKNGRFNFVGLCLALALDRQLWAIPALKDYVKACKGLRALHWSKGLKSFFKVAEVTDDEILNQTVRERVFYVSRDSFDRMGADRSLLHVAYDSDASGLSPGEHLKVARRLGIDLYDASGTKLIDCGIDSQDSLHYLAVQIKIEEALDYEQIGILSRGDDAGDSQISQGTTAGCGAENGGNVEYGLQLGKGAHCAVSVDLQAFLFDLPSESVHPDRGTGKRKRRSDPGTVPGGGHRG